MFCTEPNQLLVLEWLRVGGVHLPTNKQQHLYGLATTVLLPDRWTQQYGWQIPEEWTSSSFLRFCTIVGATTSSHTIHLSSREKFECSTSGYGASPDPKKPLPILPCHSYFLLSYGQGGEKWFLEKVNARRKSGKH